MKVYHGSYIELEKIELAKCLPQKDFGQGFYVTKFKHHAENWARVIGKKHNTQGFVTEFDYTESPFAQRICQIKHFDNYNEEWLDFVVANRQNEEEKAIHDFDIVEGPVADDKVQNRIRDYLNGEIPKQEFLKELIYHEKTHQICFCTKVSLQLLKNTDKIRVSKYAHISEPIVEILVMEFGFDEEAAADKFFSSNTFSKLADTSTQLYKETWQEIYEILKIEFKNDSGRQ
jgi:hypothetical protein